MKKLTIEDFIQRAKLVHENKYDYGLVNYTNNNTKVKIICHIHGIFEQKPSKHINGKQGCPKCGAISTTIKQTKTKEIFIKEAVIIHNNKYDYSLVEYSSDRIKVKIICPVHSIFEQTPNGHLTGRGCKHCGGTQKINQEFFINKSNKIHFNEYDYSLVEYKLHRKKVKIICKEHGVFEQTPNAHLAGKGCLKCSGKDKLTTEEFIEKAKIIHNNIYDYSLVEYINNHTKIKIICSKHGTFEQRPDVHFKRNGCQLCHEPRNEKIIREFLEKNNIVFERQKQFNDCRTKRPLPFDFYLSELNICIEFDGRQHFEPVKAFGGEEAFKHQQFKDNIKTQYCLDNNIQLIRISYKENILERLNDIKLKNYQ